MEERQRKMLEANSFMRHNGIEVTQVSPDSAQARLTIRPESLNAYGILHGGAYFTMADAAGGALARSDGRSYVTLDSSLSFIRSVSGPGEVVARASLRHRGRRTCVVAVDITDGESGQLLATCSLTFFCVGDSLPV